MKIAEIREIATNELAERIQTEVANYNQMVLNHSISPLENPAQIKKLRRTIARMKAECVRENLTNNNGPHGS
ncbi:50S ribosomal protein L29 [Phocaeicola plebeius]|uniref:50S ribosomal protein L29 n=1 Tax=Phocaeicola plebeius TaxID=310297 RepID=UPI00241BE91E|nr:50S ribosomal protein L29 [Phocaeicola plebeius]